MTLDLTRRSLLKFMGGAAVGAVLSPLPWKLLDDASIWTQNWSRIARPPRGPISWRATTCTLCPNGCGLRARLVGASFVSAWPQPGHPSGLAGLCPLGLAAAQMRFHPARVRGAVRRDTARNDAPWQLTDPDAAVRELGRLLAQQRARAGAGGLAVLDLRPGRALSHLYRGFLERQGGGLYLTMPDAWQASAAAFAGLVAVPFVAPAPDPSRARVVLSFGAPVAEGGQRLRLPPAGEGGPARPHHIQVDAAVTLSAARADRWLPARLGCEAPLALALAHVLVHEALTGDPRVADLAHTDRGDGTFGELLAEFAPERVADACGLEPALIRDTARELAARRPALVLGVGDPGAGPLGAEDEAAVWCLNLLLGAPGPSSPLGLRAADDVMFGEDPTKAATARTLAEVPDGSLDLLLVDGSFPGAPLAAGLLRRKLSGPGARVVALSPYAGGAFGLVTDLILPTPAPGEWTDDVPTPALSPRACYAWSAPVAAAPDWAAHPAEWLARLESASGLTVPETAGRSGFDAELKRRAALLQSRGEGELFDPRRGSSVPVASLADPGALADVLAKGGAWTAEAALSIADHAIRLPGSRGDLAARWLALRDGRAAEATAGTGQVLLLAGGGLAAATGAAAPPVLTKLYRESGLFAEARHAALNPATARDLGLADGATAELTTAHGTKQVIARHDASLPPGVVLVTAGPDAAALGDSGQPETDLLELCGAAQRPVWRLTAATLREVRNAHA